MSPVLLADVACAVRCPSGAIQVSRVIAAESFCERERIEKRHGQILAFGNDSSMVVALHIFCSSFVLISNVVAIHG
jgi:hypothetical protein